ncbi:acyltransferase family protein [Rhodopirellula europaea]|uniref:Membrane protein containing Acyltransferase 3 domain protein n=1 Tax=Rhodopirellula europaea 6C TaxID=1263867 RepID=M2A811_9BACT|nr:acyltransferase [Rhodopirellula europaea]EMB17746.1 membrane protein containing Acyltransferase 3 domain protein [Rhodopirellula europaea 6C]
MIVAGNADRPDATRNGNCVTTTGKTRQIYSLQVGRAVAAVAVLLHHLAVDAPPLLGVDEPRFFQVFHFGYLGVDFFFVLSGFIICYSTINSKRETTFIRFAWMRINRIFTPYLPVGVAMAVAYTMLPGLSNSARSWGWLTTVTLIPTELPPALSVAWTLKHEIMFYLFFAVCLRIGKLEKGFIVWASMIVLSMVASNVDFESPVLDQFLSPINLEFVFGFFVARLIAHDKSMRPIRCILGAAIMLGVWCFLGAERSESWIFGLAIAFLLHLIVTNELQLEYESPGALVYLGNASYSIYLVHLPVMAVSLRLLHRFESSLGGAFGLTAAACMIAGCVYHSTFESPAVRFFNRQLDIRAKWILGNRR